MTCGTCQVTCDFVNLLLKTRGHVAYHRRVLKALHFLCLQVYPIWQFTESFESLSQCHYLTNIVYNL